MKTFYQNFCISFFVLINFSGFTQDLKPTEKEALAEVSVIDINKKTRKNAKIIFADIVSKKEYIGISKPNGKFSILLPKGKKYKVSYKDFTENFDYTEMDVPNEAGELSFEIEIMFEPAKNFTLKNVFYDIGKATLRPESFKTLNNLVEALKFNPTTVIEIGGHTDNVGTPESNLLLSDNRARTVRDYLVKNGITTERLIPKGYGDTRPIADNKTEKGKQENRRTEAKIVKE